MFCGVVGEFEQVSQMCNRLFTAAAALALLAGCSGGRGAGRRPEPGKGQPAAPVCESDARADEYAVYSALLLHKFGDTQFVIREQTAAGEG